MGLSKLRSQNVPGQKTMSMKYHPVCSKPHDPVNKPSVVATTESLPVRACLSLGCLVPIRHDFHRVVRLQCAERNNFTQCDHSSVIELFHEQARETLATFLIASCFLASR